MSKDCNEVEVRESNMNIWGKTYPGEGLKQRPQRGVGVCLGHGWSRAGQRGRVREERRGWTT